MSDVTVVRNDAATRYEARIDDTLAGIAEYQLTSELIVFTHTEVDPRFEGRGVGSSLAHFALHDVRASGTHRVLPLCPFFKAWIGKHPDYQDLLYGAPASTVVD